MIAIVDTNVPIVANGRSKQASIECVNACAQQLQRIKQQGKLVLDDQWRILREYMRHLDPSGQQPGVGDAFLKWVLDNIANPARVETVHITLCDPDDPNGTDFQEFPDDPALAKFDPADRKFVAVAVAHPQHPPILNATDPDWWQFRDALCAHGVEVEFLCNEAMHS